MLQRALSFFFLSTLALTKIVFVYCLHPLFCRHLKGVLERKKFCGDSAVSPRTAVARQQNAPQRRRRPWCVFIPQSCSSSLRFIIHWLKRGGIEKRSLSVFAGTGMTVIYCVMWQGGTSARPSPARATSESALSGRTGPWCADKLNVVNLCEESVMPLWFRL